MTDYERSASIDATPSAAFGYLAEARNMPAYIAMMTQAVPTSTGLHVAAEVQGRHEEGDASFSTDAATRTIRWAGRDGSDYRGWLRVGVDGADRRSTVTIHLHTRSDTDAAEIERAIDESLANIRSAAADM